MDTHLETIGIDLVRAYGRYVERRHRRRRLARAAAAVFAGAFVFVGAAFASGIADDLQLDPAKWSILGGSDVDHGKAAYVHAKSLKDGSNTTFILEHDAGLSPYQGFVLHERVLAAANSTSLVPVATEPGALCTAAELTRAEIVALATVRASFPPGTPPDASKRAVDDAVTADFSDTPCKGLEYAGERARFVYAGIEPVSMLMPGVK